MLMSQRSVCKLSCSWAAFLELLLTSAYLSKTILRRPPESIIVHLLLSVHMKLLLFFCPSVRQLTATYQC